MRRLVLAVAVSVIGGAAGVARAARPVLDGEATFGVAGGDILVHYATTGTDAIKPDDATHDGVPAFAVEVATTAEAALQHFVALGFDRPRSDGTLGGDGRIDIYLRDLVRADGNAAIDACTGERCAGFIQAENDFAGYDYATITEGIRSVVPHELFHLVQDGYASGQSSTWTEGTAVWSVEDLYGNGNSDFERFLPSFLTKSFRPFERPVTGFGDSYPYGAALWPYFLEQRFGVGVVVAAWQACVDADFLPAIDAALAPEMSSTDQAWTEMTRWNVFTGSHAAGGPYPDASAWPEAPREAAVSFGGDADLPSGMISVEGLSARYVPITAGVRAKLQVSPGALNIAAWVVRDGGTIHDGVALTADTDALAPSGALAAMLDAGSYTLVITGLARNTITTPVAVELGLPLAPDPSEPDDSGGCRATQSPSSSLIALALALMVTSQLTRRPDRRRA